MAVALHPHSESSNFEEDVRQRPNGPRVLRLVRELTYLDGRLSSSLRKAWEFPLITVALVAGILLVASPMLSAVLVGSVLPMALGASVKPTSPTEQYTPPTVTGVELPSRSATAEEHQAWIRQGHAALTRAAGDEMPSATF